MFNLEQDYYVSMVLNHIDEVFVNNPNHVILNCLVHL